MREPEEYQEALDILKDLMSTETENNHTPRDYQRATEYIQELVDKTKPMKPIKRYYTSSYGNNGRKKRVDIKCPCCGSSFINGVRSSIGVFQNKEKEFIKTIDNQKCCRFCQQTIDWIEEESKQ